jgi:hypothetical protein
MLAITTTFEHIGHWIRMRQSLARYSAPVSSVHAPSWADFITTMVGFRVFDTHRFGSVDKNYVADTFVPDSEVDVDLPMHPTGDPRRDL